jgi:hypothetical protein
MGYRKFGRAECFMMRSLPESGDMCRGVKLDSGKDPGCFVLTEDDICSKSVRIRGVGVG